MANFANYGDLESIFTGYANKINSISEVVPSNATTSNKLATQSDLPDTSDFYSVTDYPLATAADIDSLFE